MRLSQKDYVQKYKTFANQPHSGGGRSTSSDQDGALLLSPLVDERLNRTSAHKLSKKKDPSGLDAARTRVGLPLALRRVQCGPFLVRIPLSCCSFESGAFCDLM